MLAIARTFVVLEAVHATDAGPWRVVVAADDLYPQLPVGEDLHAGEGLVAIVHLRLRSGSHRHQSSRMMLAGSNLGGVTSEGEENGTDGGNSVLSPVSDTLGIPAVATSRDPNNVPYLCVVSDVYLDKSFNQPTAFIAAS